MASSGNLLLPQLRASVKQRTCGCTLLAQGGIRIIPKRTLFISARLPQALGLCEGDLLPN
jgi:hypothetical protein